MAGLTAKAGEQQIPSQRTTISPDDTLVAMSDAGLRPKVSTTNAGLGWIVVSERNTMYNCNVMSGEIDETWKHLSEVVYTSHAIKD